MSENTNIVTEQLPPNYLAEFFAGVPGQNVPGIMPLLNQELVNRISGFGVEGANPYTYQGNRIAGFSPAEQQAFNLATAGVGSYSPYLDRATATTDKALTDSDLALGPSANYLQDAITTGATGTDVSPSALAASVLLRLSCCWACFCASSSSCSSSRARCAHDGALPCHVPEGRGGRHLLPPSCSTSPSLALHLLPAA